MFAVIAAPVLVGQATQPEKPKEEAKPEAVKLSVPLDGDEKGSGGKAALLLKAKGTAPAKAAVLTGDGGRTVAKATPATSPAACKGIKARQATAETGGTKWCLELTGIDDGEEVAGTLSGAAAAVELTVSRRNPYIGWPLLLGIAGLFVGAAVVLVPRWLRDGIRKATLDRTLDANDNASDDRKIRCLRDWVNDRRTEGDSDDALLPIVAGTIRRGPAIAARARRELAATANRLRGVLAGHDGLKAADAEAGRTDHTRAQFIDGAGEAVPHPAKALSELLETLADAKGALELAEAAIGALPPGSAMDAAQAAFDDARGAYRVADKASEAEALEDAVAKLERAVASAQAQAPADERTAPQIAILGVRGKRPLVDASRVESRDDVTAAKAVTPTPAVAAWRITSLLVLTILVAVAVAAWALASLWLTVYEPKAAFGGVDYWSLFVGAVGSGAAGAILTLVAAWDPLTPAEA